MVIMISTLTIMTAIEIGIMVEILILLRRQNTLLDLIDDNTFKSYMKNRIDLKMDHNIDLNELCEKYTDALIGDDDIDKE